MKVLNWSDEKSKKLKEERGYSFEDIVFFIQKQYILADYRHPNKNKYLNQRIMVLNIDNYAYLVPYTENGEELFLKTIIPSRKAAKLYLKGDGKNEIK